MNGVRKSSHVVTEAMKVNMKKMREEGYTYQAIANAFDVSYGTVMYHVKPKYKQRSLDNTKKWRSKHPFYHRTYNRLYTRIRYNTDPEFRYKMLRANKGGFFSNKSQALFEKSNLTVSEESCEGGEMQRLRKCGS